jgi:hypothetical protein
MLQLLFLRVLHDRAAGALSVPALELRRVAEQGARWGLEHDFGSESDLEHIEEKGCIEGADPAQVSHRAWERGTRARASQPRDTHGSAQNTIRHRSKPSSAPRVGKNPGDRFAP